MPVIALTYKVTRMKSWKGSFDEPSASLGKGSLYFPLKKSGFIQECLPPPLFKKVKWDSKSLLKGKFVPQKTILKDQASWRCVCPHFFQKKTCVFTVKMASRKNLTDKEREARNFEDTLHFSVFVFLFAAL